MSRFENDPRTVREIDEAEGILQLLTILATKGQAKRSDLLPEWGDFLPVRSSSYGWASLS